MPLVATRLPRRMPVGDAMTAIATLAALFGLAQRAESRWPHTIHLYRQRIERVVPFVREHPRLAVRLYGQP